MELTLHSRMSCRTECRTPSSCPTNAGAEVEAGGRLLLVLLVLLLFEDKD